MDCINNDGDIVPDETSDHLSDGVRQEENQNSSNSKTQYINRNSNCSCNI